jgi:hypothetical protein
MGRTWMHSQVPSSNVSRAPWYRLARRHGAEKGCRTVMLPFLMDTPLYGTTPTATPSIPPIFWIIYIAVIVFYIACEWIIFGKANQPGWAAIIPIYNTIVFLHIIGRSGWWFLIFFVPFVNIIFGIIFLHEFSKAFGHGFGFTLGLIFLSFIFIPILAFGGSRYVGPQKML